MTQIRGKHQITMVMVVLLKETLMIALLMDSPIQKEVLVLQKKLFLTAIVTTK